MQQDFLTYDKSRTNAICWRNKKKLLILIPFSIGLVTLIQSSSVLAHKHESTNHLVLPTTEEEEKEELPPSWSDSLGLQYDQLFQVLRKRNLFCVVKAKTFQVPKYFLSRTDFFQRLPRGFSGDLVLI